MPHIPADMSGTGIMVLGGLVEVAFGIDAGGKALASVATPLSWYRNHPQTSVEVSWPPCSRHYVWRWRVCEGQR